MEQPLSRVLTPFDEGIRFQTGDIHTRSLINAYAVVRWTDQWGTRWEHKRGIVRRITDAAPWELQPTLRHETARFNNGCPEADLA